MSSDRYSALPQANRIAANGTQCYLGPGSQAGLGCAGYAGSQHYNVQKRRGAAAVDVIAPSIPAPRWAFFAYGFRPFFFAALAYAILGMAAWIWIRASGAMPLYSLPPQLWHGHEMLFGFVGAAIAGFLLTAVPSWTVSKGYSGLPLILVSALWLLGRIAFAASAHLPVTTLAVFELAFLPILAMLIGPALVRARNRNAALLIVLAALWFVDATFLCALALRRLDLASTALLVGIDIILVLITVIGGRIVPTFTANALRRCGIDASIRQHTAIEVLTIGSMIGIVAVDALRPGTLWAGLIAGVAAFLQGVRLAGWQGRRCWREPIVWILHLSYLWLPLGLSLKAAFFAGGCDWASQWLHALTIGVTASMVVAVITRAALGHTGRALTVTASIAIAYAFLSVATLTRVLAGSFDIDRESMVRASAGLWMIAFAMVLAKYAPILLKPRVDGKPG